MEHCILFSDLHPANVAGVENERVKEKKNSFQTMKQETKDMKMESHENGVTCDAGRKKKLRCQCKWVHTL